MKYTTVCAIVINNKNEILLTKRQREPFKNHWALFSGIGESKKGIPSNIGVVEEVNCDLRTESFKGKFIFSLPIENDRMSNKVDVYVGNINESEININPEFSAGIKWVSTKDTEAFKDLAFEHSKIIEKYLESL